MFENILRKALRSRIRIGTTRIIYPSGRSETYGDGTGDPLVLRVADAAALRAIALDPTLAAPEMYMDGRLIVETGDVYTLISRFKANTAPERTTGAATLQHLRRGVTSAPVARAIDPRRARANVAHHYDLDERLYRLFLDEDMQYSCAWFERPDMTLEEAQLAKKRLIAAKLLVRPDAHVLDIGCGWGGMALYLARVLGARVTGVTLSQEQLRVATHRAAALGLSDRVRFELRDYRELEGEFDGIVSVGMFEHVGLRQFPTFFQTARRLLAPDGVMLLHSIGQPSRPRYNQPFIEKYIFPGGFIPALSQVTPALEGTGLLVRDIEILSLHYARTLREWRRRFLAKRAEVLTLYDERFLRMWEFYLAGSEASFHHDGMNVFHLQLVRDQERVPLTRGYIAAEMARLAQIELTLPDYARIRDLPARPREIRQAHG